MKKAFWILTFTLIAASSLCFEPASALEPIRIVFDIHIEPMPQIPLPQRYQNYLQQRNEVLWLSDTCAVQTGCKFSMESNGEFMEFLADDQDTVVVPHYLNQGHQWGTHVHPYIHTGPHNWPYAGQNCPPDTAAIVWDDNIAMVEQFITHAQNNAMSSQVPGIQSIQYQFMVDYGFEITGGGPTEVCMNFFGHLPWNPSRPSPQLFIIEDPNQRDFFQIPHFPQTGSVGFHGPQGAQAFFDLTFPSLKSEFLKLYMEWLRHDRFNDDSRVWVFGLNTHSNINYQYREVVMSFLSWLNANFVGHISPHGNLIAQYASFNNVRDAFYTWENAHPGQSSFSYSPGDPYPYSYPALVNILAYNHHLSEITNWSAQGIHAHNLEDTLHNQRWLLWKDSGTGVIDFSSVYAQPLLAHDPISGQTQEIQPNSVIVGEDPLLLTPASTIPQPPLAFENSRFGIFATHAPEFSYFEQQMGFNHSQFWDWASVQVQELNAHWTRSNLQLVWDLCQPQVGGPYNWNNEMHTDSVIVNVYEPGNELNWLGVFHEGGPGLRYALDYPNEYRQFVTDAVERFDGDSIGAVNPYVQVKWWQIGNEVPGWTSNGHNSRDYARWLQICEQGIHAADPDAKIVLIAPTQATFVDTFLANVIRLVATRVPFDAIDLHDWSPAVDWRLEAVSAYRNGLDRIGLPEVQIWSCEDGTWAYGPTQMPFQQPFMQSQFLAKRYAGNLASGVNKLFWNNLMEWYNFGGNPGSMFNCMGLIGDGALCGEPPTALNVPRPAYYSYRLLTGFLDEPTEVIGPDNQYTIPNVQYSYLYEKQGALYPFRVMWRETGFANYPISLGVNRALVTPLSADISGQIAPPYYVFADSAGVIHLNLSPTPVAVEAAPVDGFAGAGVGAQQVVPLKPTEFVLLTASYPNPFNATTAFSYKLQAASHVSLRIYDTAGRLVTTLVDSWREGGSHEVTFDASGLASGIYLYKLEVGSFSTVSKMVLMK